MIEFSELSDSRSMDFDAAMAIYDAAFPASEKQPVETIRTKLHEGAFRIFVGKDQETVAFIAIFWPFPGEDFVLLNYMAADENHRGAGIASRFLKWICTEHQLGKTPILLEVEDPAFGDNQPVRQRRVAFYQRAGARKLKGVRYILPPLSGGKPTLMLLMAIHGQPPRSLSGDCVRSLVTSLYVDLYGRAACDPLLARIFASIPAQVQLDLD